MYVLGAIWTFVVLPRRERAVTGPAPITLPSEEIEREEASV